MNWIKIIITSICFHFSLLIYGQSTYTVTTTPYNLDTLGVNADVPFMYGPQDDCFSSTIPIGFSFFFMGNYYDSLIVCSTFPYLLLLQSACNIQKRRYSNGFYLNTIAHLKENIHHQINEGEKKNTQKTVFPKSGHENLVIVSDTVDAIDNAIPVESKILKKTKHQRLFLVSDTLLKKPESHQKLATNKPVKPKMELFSKLALIAMLVNLAMVIAVPVLVIFFTAPEVVIALIIFSLFAPALIPSQLDISTIQMGHQAIIILVCF